MLGFAKSLRAEPREYSGTNEQYASFVYDPPDGRACLVRRVSGELRVPSLVQKSRDFEAQKNKASASFVRCAARVAWRGKPEDYDHRFPGTYNARRDILDD